jgi:hypothetical protein
MPLPYPENPEKDNERLVLRKLSCCTIAQSPDQTVYMEHTNFKFSGRIPEGVPEIFSQSTNGAAQQNSARQGWDNGHQTKIER